MGLIHSSNDGRFVLHQVSRLLAREIQAATQGEYTPVMLWGAPGIGRKYGREGWAIPSMLPDTIRCSLRGRYFMAINESGVLHAPPGG